ncbi:MAG: ribonuclease III [Deltaproteobacteria bacterium]|nr:ribonuclease III [Deltaproteobacteria bacterium]
MKGKKGLKGLERLSYVFKDRGLLQQALIHRSYIHENPALGLKSNERFEFLGDAVLSAVIAHLLIQRFPEVDEGELSRLRASLVNEATLARIAITLDLGQFIFLGKGERKSGGREKPSILADTYEAVIGAVYLDGGFQEVFRLVENHFSDALDEAFQEEVIRDYKTTLQEYTQESFKTIPQYVLVGGYGPEHNKVFEVEVLIDGRGFGSGKGRSKKEAEQRAAQEAISKFKIQNLKFNLES